jgi:hypothetical protein
MIHVLGSAEYERTFLSLTFLKNKVRNRVDADHLISNFKVLGKQSFSIRFLLASCFMLISFHIILQSL